MCSIAVWLIVGMVVNVCVAWVGERLGVRLGARSGMPQSLLNPSWPTRVPDSWPPPASSHRSTAVFGDSGIWQSAPDDYFGMVIVHREGWPWRAVHEWTLAGLHLPARETHGLLLVGAGKWQYAVPIYPLWPGFALNTIFYALFAWGLWQVPPAIRRRRRRRNGLCVRCGYDLKGLPPGSNCPECGTHPPA